MLICSFLSEILSVCESSLVNSLGYAIDDSAITASSAVDGVFCQTNNVRNFDNPINNHAWCPVPSKFNINQVISSHMYIDCLSIIQAYTYM